MLDLTAQAFYTQFVEVVRVLRVRPGPHGHGRTSQPRRVTETSHPLNAICPYYTMYPLSFPLRVLASASSNESVLDPFCGRGTTNFAARLRGLRSVGIDSNPTAAAVAAAKLVSVTAGSVTARCSEILSRPGRAPETPRGTFWSLAYSPDTLRDICMLRAAFQSATELSQIDIALRAVVLGILHGPRSKGPPTYLSNQMPRTYATKPRSAVRYWRRLRLKPIAVDVLAAVDRRARHCLSDPPRSSPGSIYLADSSTIPPSRLGREFDWVVTSPPYYGMRSYRPDQWLRNWFMGGPPSVVYTMGGQLSHAGELRFVEDLSEAWRNVAESCRPGARLVTRFGAIGSSATDPVDIIRRSLTGTGWRLVTTRDAGSADSGRRQAEQFLAGDSIAIREIDAYAVLDARV